MITIFVNTGSLQVRIMIKKSGDKWVLYTKDRSKKLGSHPSKKKALAQERAIQISKKLRGK